MLHTSHTLERVRQVVVAQVGAGLVQLVHDQLHPELGRLMLDDEQEFVGVLRVAQRTLSRKQRVEIEVAAVAHPVAEVGDDGFFDVTSVVVDAHVYLRW